MNADEGVPVADPIDRSRLELLQGSGAGGDLVVELIELFVADVPPRMQLIRDAVSAGDPEALMRTAHSLKGSAATLGADGMAELCRRIEEIGRAGAVTPAAELLDTLGDEFERVKSAFGDWVAGR
jgi:HPt (histidine-containing phosphotransfer) domain-containing protein